MERNDWGCYEASANHSMIILTQDNYERWSDGDKYVYVGEADLSYPSDVEKPQQGQLYMETEALDFMSSIGYNYNYPEDCFYTLEDFLADGDFISYARWGEDELMEIRCEKYFVTPSGDEMVVAVKIGGKD